MPLPVRVNRSDLMDPMELLQRDFLGRLFGNELMSRYFDESEMGRFPVDIREDADHVYVEADLPGFHKEDIDISLEEGTLTIVAERHPEQYEPQKRPPQAGQQGGQKRAPAKQTEETRQAQGGGQPSESQQQLQPVGKGQQEMERSRGNYLLRERRYQRVVRSFTLPPSVDEQDVNARFDNGCLTVTLNKRQEAKQRKIQVS